MDLYFFGRRAPYLLAAFLFVSSLLGEAGCGRDLGSTDSTSSTPDRAIEVCKTWTQARAQLAEGTWSGSLNSCEPGDMDEAWRLRTLAQINAYRFLAELSPVDMNPGRNQKAQECALMMDKNRRLSHTPDSSWACYSEDGELAAGASNIATTPAILGVDAYIVDNGNADTLGHRRWILSNQLGPVGIGSTSEYSCLWVGGGSGDDTREWIAWPPDGPIPIDAFTPRRGMELDSMGWSFQSDGFCIGEAQIKVVSDGQVLPVRTGRLEGSYGDWCAVYIIPSGWKAEVNRTYSVQAKNQTRTIDYEVRVVDCEAVLNQE